MGQVRRPDYIRKFRRPCPDFAITHVEEISDRLMCMVLVVSHDRVLGFVAAQDQSWVAEKLP